MKYVHTRIEITFYRHIDVCRMQDFFPQDIYCTIHIKCLHTQDIYNMYKNIIQ